MSGRGTVLGRPAVAGDAIILDTSTPRMPLLWNHWAGGKDAGPAEEAFGGRVQELFPVIEDVARFRG